jgi:hypothetical protein
MAIFASTTLGSSDPSRAMSIKALEARAQALAAAQSRQEAPTSIPSPWQGFGNVLNTAADAFATRRADQATAQRRQDLAGYIARAGDNPTMADVGQITAADSDVGKTYLQEIQARRSQAAQIQAAKDLAAQKAQQDEAAAAAQEQRVLARPPNEDLINLKRGLQQGIITQEEYDQRAKKLNAGSPAEQKLVTQEQEGNIDLQSLLGSLKEAQGLANTGIYEGPGAKIRSMVGENVGSVLPGVTGINAETTARTQRFNQILSGPVLETLNKMKGSSSDRDLLFAIDTLNNQNATLDNKKAALDTVMRKIDAHMRASDQRLKEMGGKKVEIAPPTTSAGASAAAAPAAGGGDLLEKARSAIAAGAPRDKVIERLKAAGIDPSGL